MTPALPLYHDQWPALAQVAASLRDQREGYFGAEDPRVRRMTEVAAIWAAVVALAPIEADHDWPAIRADLDATAAEADRRADASPGNTIARQRADAVAAIAWHFRAYDSRIDTPMLVFCHRTTLALQARARATIAARASAPAAPQQRAPRPAPGSGALFEHAA